MYFVIGGGFIIFFVKSVLEFRLIIKNKGDENGDGFFKAFTFLGLSIYLVFLAMSILLTILYAEYQSWGIPPWSCLLPLPLAYISLFITSSLPFFAFCGKNLAAKDFKKEMLTIMK
jgi:hypothetical protein